MFFAALLTKAKTWKKPKCPSNDEWIKRIKWIKEQNNAMCSNMDGPRDCHTE